MPIVFPNDGLAELMETLLANQVFRANLYQNDRVPKRGDTIGDYTPCDFSGYSGFQLLEGWSPVVVQGDRATSRSGTVTWHHNGGPTDNFIYGVFVTSPGGVLIFAERYPLAPHFMSPAQPNFSYAADLSDISEFAGPP